MVKSSDDDKPKMQKLPGINICETFFDEDDLEEIGPCLGMMGLRGPDWCKEAIEARAHPIEGRTQEQDFAIKCMYVGYSLMRGWMNDATQRGKDQGLDV